MLRSRDAGENKNLHAVLPLDYLAGCADAT
jgi:hypothetical protein